MTRALLPTLGAALALAATAGAQAPDPEPPTGRAVPVAHYGKWVTAATAVAFTWLAVREHERSQDAWDRLLGICAGNSADCALGPDGRYLNAAAEQLYQTSLHYDGRARVRLLAGQGALLVTVGLFILDLKRGGNGPEDIPFAPLEISPDRRTGGARVGLRIAF